MKCHGCNGDGKITSRISMFDAQARGGVRRLDGGEVTFDSVRNEFVRVAPCAECNGSGQAHCCDGLQAQADFG